MIQTLINIIQRDFNHNFFRSFMLYDLNSLNINTSKNRAHHIQWFKQFRTQA